jgi:hypothetical protein
LDTLEARLAPADLTLTRGTYLGSANNDDVAGVVATDEGAVWLAIDVNGSARLQQHSTTAGTVASADLDLGGSDSRDIARSVGTGNVVVVGNFGVRVFSPTGVPLWQQTGTFDRVATSDNGTVVALNTSTDTLTVWSARGDLWATTTLTGGDVRSADVTIDPLTQRIFVTGYTQTTATLQVPFVRAFDRAGSQIVLAWDAWDFAAGDVQAAGLTADSRGVRIEWGTNGGLYFLGRMDGGNTVFGRDSNDLATALGSRLVDPDNYTDTSNTSGAKTFTFYAKLRISDGYVERGQVLVTRLSNGQANSFTPSAIAADRWGNVYVGGSSASALQDRDTQTINGATVGAYRLGEPAILSVSANFATRRFWTALTAPGDADGAVGSIAGFAVVGDAVALAANVSTPSVATVANDTNPNALGGSDAYLATVAGVVPTPTTLTVTTNLDSGPGSLRDTLASAPSQAIVRFAPSLANQTITLQSQLTIQNDVTIDGQDAANLTLSGNNTTRILRIDYKFIDVTLRYLTFTQGKAVDADAGTTLRGGAIELLDPNTLTVENCTFTNNAGERSGAIFVGYGARATIRSSTFVGNDGTAAGDGFSAGAISTYGGGTGSTVLANGVGGSAFLDIRDCTFTNNTGTYGAVYVLLGGLRVEDSTFTANVGTSGAGAIFTDGANGGAGGAGLLGGETFIRNVQALDNRNNGTGSYGGAFYFYGYSGDAYVIENSTLLNNVAFRGGALGVQATGTTSLLIRNTTLAGNNSLNQGGALWTDVDGPDGIRIENSTFSGNRNTDGMGGGTIGGAIVFNVGTAAKMVITNSTFANNFSAEQTGNIWIAGAPQAQNLTITNSLFAGNRAPTFGGTSEQTVNFPVLSGGGNFIQLGGNGKFENNLPGATAVADLKLSATLQTYSSLSGPVLLHTLLPGSPAIDAGVSGPPLDQRGQARTDGDGVGGIQPDAGAFEAPAFGTPTLPLLSIVPVSADQLEGDSGTTSFTFTITRTGDVSAASSVTWTVSGTAVDAADFGGTLPTGTIDFVASQTTATLTVLVSGDSLVEPDEAFTVTLSNPTNAALDVSNSVAVIRNDDSAPTEPPTLTATGQNPAAVVGTPVNFTPFTATGTPTPSFTATGLPTGLSINANTGTISGTPSTAGTYVISVTATNSAGGATDSVALTVAVAPLQVVVNPLIAPPAIVGVPFSYTYFVVTGTPDPVYSATGLPPGLTIDPASGQVSGTPTEAGQFSIRITASNGVSPPVMGGFDLTVTLSNPPTITSSPLSTARVGRLVNFAVTATSDTPLTFSATGLPTGLSINPLTGVISGEPAVFGTFTGTLTVTNASGSATQDFTLVVARFFDPGVELVTVSGPPTGTTSSFAFDPTTFQTVAVAGKSNFAPFTGTGDVRATTADVDGDGVADFVYATGPNLGTGDQLRVLSGATGKDLLTAGTFRAYAGENFTTIGLFVQAADIDGDGTAEIVVSPDQGGGARLQVFQLQGGTLVQAANFFGIDDPAFRGGGRIALGDVNADGFQDVIVGAGFGGGPRIAVFSGKGLTSFGSAGSPPKLLGDFIVFNPGAELLRNGTWVSAGDVNGDGFADLLFGAGPGGGPRVTLLDGQTLVTSGSVAADARPLANFFGGDVNQRGGIRVTLKDVDADRLLDVVVGAGEGAATSVSVYLGKNLPASGQGTPTVTQTFDPFGLSSLANGVFVG